MDNIRSILNENVVNEINRRNQSIEKKIAENGVILFGSGNLGKKILQYFTSKNVIVHCIVDNNINHRLMLQKNIPNKILHGL